MERVPPGHDPQQSHRGEPLRINPAYVIQGMKMVQDVKPGGVFMINCQWSDEELAHHLNADAKKYIADNNIQLYTINAIDKAKKGLRPRDNVVACADKGSPMTVPVKILSVLTGLSLAGSVQARIWTNDRGATVVAVLVAVRDAEVDLKLQDGRIVAVPKNVFSGADQAYILEWVKSGGTLPDTDVGAENPPAQGASGGRYVESYVGSILATFAIGASAGYGWNGMFLPLAIAVVGVICSLIGSFMIKTGDKASQRELLKSMRTGTYFAAALCAVLCIPRRKFF